MFYHQKKHWEESWEYDEQWSIFDKLRGVLSGDTVSNAFYYFSNKMILEGQINDARMSSFSSDFQTLIKHLIFSVFSSWIIKEFEKVFSTLSTKWTKLSLNTCIFGAEAYTCRMLNGNPVSTYLHSQKRVYVSFPRLQMNFCKWRIKSIAKPPKTTRARRLLFVRFVIKFIIKSRSEIVVAWISTLAEKYITQDHVFCVAFGSGDRVNGSTGY